MPSAQPAPSVSARPHQVLPFPLPQDPARLRSVAPARGNLLRAAAALAAKTSHACLGSCFALVSWVMCEFLDGFAVYAMAIYGIPRIPDRLGGDDTFDPSPAEPRRGTSSGRPQTASAVRLVKACDDGRR